MHADCLNVYVGVNPRRNYGDRKADGVTGARCFVVDFDEGATIETVLLILATAGLPKPSMIVASGHGIHVYWFLKSLMVDMKLWTRYQKALIGRLGSDPIIHDAPRIIRLPGTSNFKSDPVVPCEILTNTGHKYDPAEVIEPIAEDSRPAPSGPVTPARREEWGQRMSRATLAFLAVGAAEGGRNKALFDAACDFAGNGVSQGEADSVLRPPALACGLEGWEVDQAMKSAYGRPRNPAKPEPIEIDGVWIAGMGVIKPATDAPTKEPGGVAIPSSPPAAARIYTRRGCVANVSTVIGKDSDGEDAPTTVYKPMDQFARELLEHTAGWPASVCGLLFAPREVPGDPLPGMRAVWMLPKPEVFGAWLHDVADVRWAAPFGVVDGVSGEPRTPVGKAELHEWLKANAPSQYQGVSTLPHEPRVPGIYYTPCKLPPATGEAVREFLAGMNAETDVDRLLMLAAIVTPGWGGEPGTRPAFGLYSEHGRGVGKTSTVIAIAELLWGGVMTIKPEESWEKVIGRLLGDGGLSTRCLLWDNIKGRQDSAAMDSILTSRTIDGWRPHFGQYSRPNLLTYFFTANSPKLSEDMAVRAVLIKVGAQHHETDFMGWATRLMAACRSAILADVYAILAGPALTIRAGNVDRWQAWQRGVLARCASFLGWDEGRLANALSVIKDRRGDANDDEARADILADSIQAWLMSKGRLGSDPQRITRDEMREIMVVSKITEDKGGMNVDACQTYAQNLCAGKGPLSGLKYVKRVRAMVGGASVRAYWEWSATLTEPTPGAPNVDAMTGDEIPI